MYTRRRRRLAEHTTTSSDDSSGDDDDGAGMLAARYANFMPSSARSPVFVADDATFDDDDDDASLRAAPVARASSSSSSSSVASVSSPPPARAEQSRTYAPSAGNERLSIIDERAFDRFVDSPGRALERAEEPDALAPEAEFAAWQRCELEAQRRLDEHPVYRQAQLVHVLTGVALEKLVRVPSLERPAPRRRAGSTWLADTYESSVLNDLARTAPPAPAPAPAQTAPERDVKREVDIAALEADIDELQADLHKLEPVEDDAGVTVDKPDTPEGAERTTPPASPTPKFPAAPAKRVRAETLRLLRTTLTEERYAVRSAASPALYARYLERVRAKIATELDTGNGPDDARVRELIAQLRERERLMRALDRFERRHTHVAATSATNIVAVVGALFKAPLWYGAQRLALDLIRFWYPSTLAEATIDSFERADAHGAASLFAQLSAAYINRGAFVAGRRPQRASDYDRYAEDVRMVKTQMRYARVRASDGVVEIVYTSIADFRRHQAARVPECTLSSRATTVPYARTGDSLAYARAAERTRYTAARGTGSLRSSLVAFGRAAR